MEIITIYTGRYSASFSDVAADHWAARFIAAAQSNGWIQGFGDGTFRPDEPITRAQVVTMINRVLKRGAPLETTLPNPPQFTDLSSNHWAYADIVEASVDHEYTTTADAATDTETDGEATEGENVDGESGENLAA
jgi:hypothetical protein